MAAARNIALIGNPNCGKSSLFNALTGLRQRVGNFPGVTVERKVAHIALPGGQKVRLIDLPGTYGIYPRAEDESIATQILLEENHSDHPDLVVVVADATMLRRSLLLCTQVMDLGLPVLLAVNMTDLLEKEGLQLDTEKLSSLLGIDVVAVSALKNKGLKALKAAMAAPRVASGEAFFRVPESFDEGLKPVMQALGTQQRYRAWHAWLQPEAWNWQGESVKAQLMQRRPLDPQALMKNELAVRYDRIDALIEEVRVPVPTRTQQFTRRLDALLVHKVWGYLIFILILGVIFQSIFKIAEWPMAWIEDGFAVVQDGILEGLGGGWFADLLANGVWAGLGGIVIFVPQIAILFFFISLLEDSGYMSRAVFLMDRVMRPFGFSGRSVIPLMGGMACAVPSIMMARSISNRTERLITIMVTPLMSCAARLPVYVLLIGMFVPDDQYVLGFIGLQGLALFGMYLLGFVMALLVALVIKLIARYKSDGIFVTEMPAYRMPRWKNTLLEMYQKSATFVWEAGRVIMVISIVLWFMQSYGPGTQMEDVKKAYTAKIEAAQAAQNDTLAQQLEKEKGSEMLRASYAGKVGQVIEPVIRPLGFDWKIGIALITSFAAREVFVGTMATIYSTDEEEVAGEGASDSGNRPLKEKLLAETDANGKPVYTLAVALSLLVFYAFAMQCMSTLAVVKKETQSWKMTAIMLFYMTGLAWLASLVTYQIFA